MNSIEFHWIPLDSLAFNGIHWDSMGFIGIQWDSLGFIGIHWKFNGIHWYFGTIQTKPEWGLFLFQEDGSVEPGSAAIQWDT